MACAAYLTDALSFDLFSTLNKKISNQGQGCISEEIIARKWTARRRELPFIRVTFAPLSRISSRRIQFTVKVGRSVRSNLNRTLSRFMAGH